MQEEPIQGMDRIWHPANATPLSIITRFVSEISFNISKTILDKSASKNVNEKCLQFYFSNFVDFLFSN